MQKPIAIVTGASRGIGRAIVENLSNQGFIVVSASRNMDVDWAKKNASIVPLSIDLRKEHERSLLIEKACTHGPIKILINNAGQATPATLDSFDSTAFAEMLALNIEAPMHLIALASKHMPPGSTIVNIASIAGVSNIPSFPGLDFYAASKAALIRATEALASSLGPLGIRINALSPGAVRTEMLKEVAPEYNGPMNEPENVAKSVVWLAGKESAPMSGRNLVLC